MKRVLMTALLLLVLTAPAVAHDREAHERRDNRQSTSDDNSRGRSPSCPDQDGKGRDSGRKEEGCDKPRGTGGDGNNGCGNESRSEGHPGEDDNNGKCGGSKTDRPTPSPRPEEPTPTPSDTPSPSASGEPTPTPTAGATVGGTRQTIQPTSQDTDDRGSTLPFTGGQILRTVLIGLAAIALGIIIWRM